MKNILFVAHLQSHIVNFHMPYINYFQKKGYTVYVASKLNSERYSCLKDTDTLKWINVDIPRAPYSPKAVTSLNELVKLMKEVNFDLVHVHTPVGGILGRLAAKITKTAPVLYTAHGFHFYKGSPKLNWGLFYPAEYIASKWTDGLITINEEDFDLANRKFKNSRNTIFKVNGVGVKLQNNVCGKTVRKNLNLTEDNFVITMIGELNKNKNQRQLLDALPKIVEYNCDVRVLFAGEGEEEENLRQRVKELKLEEYVVFLGWRDDIYDVIDASNIICSFSKREGLPKNIMEAMMLGKPVVATKIRGNKDLIKHKVNGYLVEVNDISNTADFIIDMIANEFNMVRFRQNTLIEIEKYKEENVVEEMDKIYGKYLCQKFIKDENINNNESLSNSKVYNGEL